MKTNFGEMPNNPFVVTSIDGLTTEQRRAKYDTHKCGRCGADHKPELAGWYVPDFSAYFDREYHCPTCLEFYEQTYQQKQAILKSLPSLHAALDEKRIAIQEIYSHVERDEYGVLHYEASYDGESITMQTLVDAFQEYEAQEPEIIRIRKELDEIRIERDRLRKLQQDAFAGSGFRPKANT